MALRTLASELKDYPATTTFCLLWIGVFVAMVGTQFAAGVYPSWSKLLLVGIGDGHRFGDLALQDLARGEYWRLITSTFVHFSVLHLVLNLIAMYQLGTMVESWYGKYQSLFIYGLTGGGGNVVSVLIRHAMGSNPRIHSGGGSVVIMGLVGLCAVVGLRSRTELGVSMGRLMVFFMVTTAILGAALPQFIDNWGHAGGALVGIAVGFAHRRLLEAVNKPAAWGRGMVMGIIIAACGAAQVVADRREAPLREAQRLIRRLSEVERNYRVLAQAALLVRQQPDIETVLKLLDSLSFSSAGYRPSSADPSRLRALAQAAKDRPLSAEESREVTDRLTVLLEQVHRDYMAERKRFWRLRDGPRFRQPQK
jgi:rhomboid protease GluP